MDGFCKFIENSIGRIPIIGTPLGAIILMLVGVGYWRGFVAFFTLILLPYMLIIGMISPEKVEGKSPFDSSDDYGSRNRIGFASVLILRYGLPLGTVVYFLFFRR